MRTERQPSEGVLSVTADGLYVVNRAPDNNDEPKCITFSKSFILVTNALSFLGGLALVGLGIYVVIEFNAKFSGLLSENAAIGAIVAGCILSLISCFGIFGLINSRIRFLLAYTVVLVAILITILAVLGLFVDYINTVSQVSTGTLTVFTPRQVEVNDFFASSYTKCCVQNTVFCSSSVPGTEGYCPPVPFCNNRTGTEICYAGDYGANPSNPPRAVFQEFCGTLVAFGMAGPALSSTGLCGFPDGATGFMQKVFAWVGTNIMYPYICIGLLSALLFLEILLTLLVARHIHLVKNGDFDFMKSKRKNRSTGEGSVSTPTPVIKKISHMSTANSVRLSQQGSQRADVNSSRVISLADPFRFNEDEFDTSMKNGMSASDNDRKSVKSGHYESANPIFKSLFSSNHTTKSGRINHEEDPPEL